MSTRATPPTDPDAVVRPFADWLREQSGGSTHEELGDGLHDLIARVRDTGKAGSITLTVKVKPLKENDRMFVVSDEIKLNLPEHDRKASMFYTDAEGNLVRNDPDQMEFESLREVAPPTTATVDLGTGEILDTPKTLRRKA